jgi:hypothetical protein
MTDNLEIKLHRVTLVPDLKGTRTLPTVGCYDSKFPERYVPAVKTNIAETWKRAVDAMGERTRERVAA